MITQTQRQNLSQSASFDEAVKLNLLRASAVLNSESVALKFHHCALETERSRGKWTFEDDLKGRVVSVYCDVTLAKE